jgi:signal transduction histidine kinase
VFHHFIRARLHRRLFVWFTLAMVTTGLAVGVASGLSGRLWGAPSWHQSYAGAQALLRSRFEKVWSDSNERDLLAREVSQALTVRVEMEDAQGRSLGGYGPTGGHEFASEPISQNGNRVGTVRLVGGPRAPLRAAMPLLIAALVLWGFAGAISRRIARPFFQLAQVARDLGAGRLKSRAPLRRQYGEAYHLANAMNEMADRIERQLAEQRELLAAVSHELRTPLARVRIVVELLRQGAPSAKLLDDLDGEVVEIDRLVGELLASARVEFGTLTVHALDPAELARRALERAGLDASLLQTLGPLPTLQADATLLLRALANLLDNARIHGKGVAAMRVSSAQGEVEFAVEDSGPGFAPGEEAKAFQPFRRTQTGGPREAGSLGLGLSLVERIARAHGGRAFARNRPAGGAVVGFSLPRAPAT